MAKKRSQKNTGKKFESLSRQIFELLSAEERYVTVQEDVQLEGKDGTRQIDVLVKARVAGIEITTIVECRDLERNLDITPDYSSEKMKRRNPLRVVPCLEG